MFRQYQSHDLFMETILFLYTTFPSTQTSSYKEFSTFISWSISYFNQNLANGHSFQGNIFNLLSVLMKHALHKKKKFLILIL